MVHNITEMLFAWCSDSVCIVQKINHQQTLGRDLKPSILVVATRWQQSLSRAEAGRCDLRTYVFCQQAVYHPSHELNLFYHGNMFSLEKFTFPVSSCDTIIITNAVTMLE